MGEGEGGKGMWEEVVRASRLISEDFLWIRAGFLHVDLHFLSKVYDFWRVSPSIGASCLQQKKYVLLQVFGLNWSLLSSHFSRVSCSIGAFCVLGEDWAGSNSDLLANLAHVGSRHDFFT